MSGTTNALCRWFQCRCLWSYKGREKLCWWFSGTERTCQCREQESGRSPGRGNGTPPQHSCLGNPKYRGAWRLQSMGLQMSWTQWLNNNNPRTGIISLFMTGFCRGRIVCLFYGLRNWSFINGGTDGLTSGFSDCAWRIFPADYSPSWTMCNSRSQPWVRSHIQDSVQG